MAHGKTLELQEITVPEPEALLAEEGKTYYDTEGVPFRVGDPVLHEATTNRASRRHFFDGNGKRHNIVNPQSHSRTWWKKVNLVRHWKNEQFAQRVGEVTSAKA